MNKKKLAIGGAVLVILIAVFAIIYGVTRPETSTASKEITVLVVADDETTTFTYETDDEYLGTVLVSEGLCEGSESEYGLFITTVNGREADSSNEEWWCITKGGETVNTGADTTPIYDGDTFEITLTVGY